jgi:diguanylate cyclase (GGDEF)-like protein
VDRPHLDIRTPEPMTNEGVPSDGPAVDEAPPWTTAVAAFAAVVGLGAGALGFVLSDVQRLADGPHVPWPAILAACFLAEVFLVHFEHRREGHSISFSAVPLVVGLYALAPVALAGARVLGAVAALAGYRRQPVLKVSVNVVSVALETMVAVVVFRALQVGGPLAVTAWPAAILAALAGDLVQATVVTVAISLHQRHFEVLLGPALLGPVVAVANASIGLVAVTLIVAQPAALALLAGLVPILLVSYRAHAKLREEHRRLEQLYDFTRHVSDAVIDGRVVATLLVQTRELMHAESSWLCVEDADGGTVRVRSTGNDVEALAMPGGGIDDLLHRLAQSGGKAELVAASDETPLGFALHAAGITEALVAPLAGLNGSPGTLVVTDRSGDIRTFGSDDLRLFATVTSHASASLENSHLLDKLREKAAENEFQALHDPLTGLANRSLFGQRLAASLDVVSPLSVLLLDLDRFKEVNDTLGHHNGDLLLAEVGRRLAEVLGQTDLVARLGGDEFAVLLPDAATGEEATVVARRLLAALAAPFTVDEITLRVAASVGVVVAPDHGNEVALLLQRADVAMYTAKTDHVGVAVYSPERDEYSPDRLALAGKLRRAIEHDELAVHFQPQVELASGRVIGAEALVRWTDGAGKAVSAMEIVTLAEHTGLISALTKLVLRRAVRECSTWWERGWRLRVSVNVSARDLQPGLIDDVRDVLQEVGLPAEALCLELTETGLVGNEAETVVLLNKLRELGITLAVDDFGIGYSSLAYLKSLPIGEVKVDKSFVFGMRLDSSDEAIVRSVVDLGRNLGIPVVAEGIETPEVRDALRALGCEVGQGYLFSRPMAGPDFTAWLTGANITSERRALRRTGSGRLTVL